MVNQVQLLHVCPRARAGRIVAAVVLGFMVSSVDASHAETVVGSGAAPIGSFDSARVLCPAGMTASGGGIDLFNVLTMSVTSSAPVFDDGGTGQRLIFTPNGTQPAPIGWQAAARNESSAQGDLKVASVCEATSDTVTVVGSGAAPIGSFDSERVLCPAGMTAIGGGIDLFNVLTMTVTSSGPVFDDGGTGQRLISTPNGTQPAPIGWQAGARNESSAQGDLKVAAVCKTAPTVVTVVGSGAAPIGSFDTARVLCPAGMTAIGGGIDLFNVLTMTVTSSGPVFDDGGTGQRLISTPNGTQPAPIGWQAAARNESSAQGDLKVAVICAPEPEASLLAACVVATLVTVRRLRATPA